MMLSVDSVAPLPAPGLRNGGRAAGSSDSTFQDCLDGVPEDDTDAPANAGSSAQPDDDSIVAEPQRKPRRPSDDANLAVAAAPVVPVAPLAPASGPLSIAVAVSDVTPAVDGTGPTDGSAALLVGDGALSALDPSMVSAEPASLLPATSLAVSAPPPTPAGAAALPLSTLPASAMTADEVVATTDAGADLDVSAQADSGAGAAKAVDTATGIGTDDSAVVAAIGASPASSAAPAEDAGTLADVTAPSHDSGRSAAAEAPTSAPTEPNAAPTRPRTVTTTGVGVAQQASVSDVATAAPPSAMGRAKRVLSSGVALDGRPTAPAGQPLNNGHAESLPAAALDRAAAPAVVAAPVSADARPVTVTAGEVGPLHVDVDLGGEGLGPLRLRAEAIGNELHVSLSATDPHLRATLVDNAPDLRRDLHSSGLELASFDVNGSADQNPDAGADNGDGARQQRLPEAGKNGTTTGSARVRLLTDSIQPVAAQQHPGLDLRL